MNYWETKLGCGEGILCMTDYIEFSITYPTDETADNYNPIRDSKVLLKQYDSLLSDPISRLEFPARKLRKWRKVIGRVQKDKPCQIYEIVNDVFLIIRRENEYRLESDTALFFITDLKKFCEAIDDLLVIFEEQCDNY